MVGGVADGRGTGALEARLAARVRARTGSAKDALA